MSNVSEVVKKQLDDFRRELRLEIRTIKDSVKFSSDAADNVAEIMKDMKEMRLDMKKLVERNRELEIENQQLHQRVDELEQYQRLHNLEIKGLPSECDETTVIKEIVNKLGETLDEQDIDVCHKVKIPHSAEKNVIVRFTRRSKRNVVLAKARKARLTTESLGFDGTSKKIYINEHLTPKNKRLLGAVVARKKAIGWKFVWTTDGKVLARRGESTPTMHITSLSDVERMMPGN